MFIRTVQKEALKMAKIGYARVSSREQHLDRQLTALKNVDKLFTDKLSGTTTNRPELQKMLAYIREGDIVLVTELDRLGRNNQDLTKIMNTIQNKGGHPRCVKFAVHDRDGSGANFPR